MMPGSSSAPPEGRLFQERLRFNPFWMIVACQLVNLTTWKQAEPTFRWLLATYLTPTVLADAAPDDLHEAMKPLGLWRRRSIMLIRFAHAWSQERPGCYDDVLKLPGCGKYAADSWAIFVEQRLDVQPKDGKLGWYIDRMKETV